MSYLFKILLPLSKFLLGIISGFSIFFFLYFFEAFSIKKGSSYSGHSHFFRSFSFGLLTLFFFTITETITLKLKQKKLYLWCLITTLITSQFVFLLFNFFWNWEELNWKAYLLIQKEFPLMMLFPVIIYIIWKKNIKNNLVKEEFFLFKSENNKDQLRIRLKDFLFANSLENYITIKYKSNNNYKEHLIRKPLKKLEEEFKTNSNIKRIHRSYIVNTHQIQNIQQKKGKVILEVQSFTIPVSKQYHSIFLN